MLLPKQLYGVCIRLNINHPLSPLAPCAPDAIDVKLRPMRDQIQVMRFNWTQVTCNNTEYILKLTGTLLGDSQSQFELSSYYTSVTYFEIPLPCGSSYVATVESRNAAGASDPSAPLNGTTGRLQLIMKSKRTFYISADSSNDVSLSLSCGQMFELTPPSPLPAPCPPSGVVYTGNSSFVTVSWNASVLATMYTVYDNSVAPKVQLCTTAGLSCSLANIASTNLLITASNAAGESETTNVTHGKKLMSVHEEDSGDRRHILICF